MIKEAYISLEVAKLLKENGFNEKCEYCYAYFDDDDVRVFELNPNKKAQNLAENRYPYVTHQMAMAWLREVRNMQIQITPIISRHKDWTFEIYKEFNPLTIDLVCFPTYEEACEAALKYCLENLL